MMDVFGPLLLFIGVWILGYSILSVSFLQKSIRIRVTGTRKHDKGTPKNAFYLFRLFLNPLGDKILKLTPQNMKNKLNNLFELANIKGDLATVLFLKVLLSFIFPSIVWSSGILSEYPSIRILLMIFLAVVGFLLLDFILQNKVKTRQQSIRKSLLPFIDYLMISVEAGLGIDLAIAKIISKLHGPLAEELAMVITEIKYGKSRNEAFKNFAAKVNVPELTNLVNALLTGEQFGIGICNILRIQGQQLREKRKQQIQEEAYKVSVKLIFPLVIFILPGLFIVSLGPALIQVLRGFF